MKTRTRSSTRVTTSIVGNERKYIESMKTKTIQSSPPRPAPAAKQDQKENNSNTIMKNAVAKDEDFVSTIPTISTSSSNIVCNETDKLKISVPNTNTITKGFKSNISSVAAVQNNNKTMKEWWKLGCFQCTNCIRQPCQKCFLCLSVAADENNDIINNNKNKTKNDEDDNNIGANNNENKNNNNSHKNSMNGSVIVDPTTSSNDNDLKWKSCRCYQKMCLKIPEEQKLQPAPYFPDGWRFGFVRIHSRITQLNGLLLIEPETKNRYRTVENAIKYTPAISTTVDAIKFYNHVGLVGVQDTLLSGREENLQQRHVNVNTTSLNDDDTNNFTITTKAMDVSSLDGSWTNEGKKDAVETTNNNGNVASSPDYRDPRDKEQHVYSSVKEVGARVYAKYTNDEWYWGNITKVVTKRNNRGDCQKKFSIVYDDGDRINNISEEHLVTEQEYFDITKRPPPTPIAKERANSSPRSFPDARERVSFSLIELFQLRCKVCSSCKKKDCDKCLSCCDNRLSTSRNRRVCLFNMCEQIPNVNKAQPVPGLPRGWNFYISSMSTNNFNHDSGVRRSRSIHPDLAGLHIISPDGKTVYRSMEDAVRDCKFDYQKSHEIIEYFYENMLGIPARCVKANHQLIGHGFHREWVDGTGRAREVYGEIIACWEALVVDGNQPELFFSIRYENETREVLRTTSLCQLTIPEVDDNVPEHEAWGGFLSFTKRVKMTAIDQMIARNAPFHCKWIVPTMRYAQSSKDSDFKSLVMITRGFRLELEAKPSGIPNSGYGLWIKCTPASTLIARDVSHFELAPGEAVDLGVYAPTDDRDRRPEHVNLLKTFIHNWDCESWCFEMVNNRIHGNDVFDITDDITGDLHDKAAHNIVVYANETDGVEIPTLFAEHDPEGSVHYYMGHRLDIYGAFRLPVNGESIELKIDYGPKYENVRVRKGYSRLSEAERMEVQEALKNDDAEVLREIQEEFSAKDSFDVIKFLENLFNAKSAPNKTGLPCDKLVRALVVALSLHKRVSSILKEFSRYPLTNSSMDLATVSGSNEILSFCDNGYTDMRQKKTFERSRKLIDIIVHHFDHADQLKEAVCSDQLYATVVIEMLSIKSIDEISATELRERLLSFQVLTT